MSGRLSGSAYRKPACVVYSVHIPYRNSALTRILEPALGGNNKTAIICCITQASKHVEETRRYIFSTFALLTLALALSVFRSRFLPFPPHPSPSLPPSLFLSPLLSSPLLSSLSFSLSCSVLQMKIIHGRGPLRASSHA